MYVRYGINRDLTPGGREGGAGDDANASITQLGQARNNNSGIPPKQTTRNEEHPRAAPRTADSQRASSPLPSASVETISISMPVEPSSSRPRSSSSPGMGERTSSKSETGACFGTRGARKAGSGMTPHDAPSRWRFQATTKMVATPRTSATTTATSAAVPAPGLDADEPDEPPPPPSLPTTVRAETKVTTTVAKTDESPAFVAAERSADCTSIAWMRGGPVAAGQSGRRYA
mmetsp:Transcript_20737/g.82753  ORF Transcript_20737/g.82753 Transcript_20737/m.82753 type:complete len:231 (+) Transcript_20737:667-1359(+)